MQSNKIKLKDKFIYRTEDGKVYGIEIININKFREPSAEYGIDVYYQGLYLGDVVFVGKEFLDKCEKIEE